MYQFILAQKTHPRINDWYSGVRTIMNEFKIYMTDEEIKKMPENSFKQLVKEKKHFCHYKIPKNEAKQSRKGVNIKYETDGTQTNANGFYELTIPANTDVTIVYSHVSHKNVKVTVNLKNGETFEFNPVMKVDVEQISTVVISGRKRKDVQGIVTIEPSTLKKTQK